MSQIFSGPRTQAAMHQTVTRCAKDALSKLPRKYVAANWEGRDPSIRAVVQAFFDRAAKASDDRERLVWEQRLERWGA